MHPLEFYSGKTPDTKFKLPDSKIRRGIVSAGCSFTWGQGLYYYYNLPTIMEPPPNHFHRHLINDAHLRAMESLRYPRLLANKLNTFEVVHPNNGGAEFNIIDYWERVFNPHNHRYFTNYDVSHRPMQGDSMYAISEPNYDFDEFAYITYQFTMPSRTKYVLKYQDGTVKEVTLHQHGMDEENLEYITSYLLENNITYEELLQRHCINVVNMVKSFLQKFEQRGVKARILSWPKENVPHIMNDEWMRDRFVTFHYNEKNYTSLEHLMEENNEMKIDSDPFFSIGPGDHHASKKCHELIAESLVTTMDINWIHR